MPFRVVEPARTGRFRVVEPRQAPEADTIGGVVAQGLGLPVREPRGKAAALDMARRAVDATPDQLRTFNKGVTFNYNDELAATISAGTTGAKNLALRATGREVPYSSGEAYDAVMQANREADERFARAHPVQNAMLQVGGGVAAPGAKLAGGLIKGATTLKSAVGRSAAIGAAYGALAGSGEAEGGLENRAKGAVSGAKAGAAFGAAVPVAARVATSVVPRIASGVSEATSRVARTFGKRPGEAVVTPKATERAEALVRDMAARRGITPEVAAVDPALARGKPITGAELLGREAQTQLTAIGRRGGQTGDVLEEVIRGRTEGAGGRIIDDFGRATNLDPATLADDFGAMTAALRARAGPVYDKAYAAGPVDSAKLQDLMRRPGMKEAMRKAYLIAKEEGRNPEELGLIDMDTFDGLAAAGPAPRADIDPRDVTALAKGVEPKAGQGDSLLSFLSKNGGVRDYGGELRARDADIWHRNKPFLRRLLNEEGLSAEEAAQRAHDAGYFPDRAPATMEGSANTQVVTADDLYAAIDQELSGKPLYARKPELDDVARRGRLDGLERRLQEAGIDPRKATPDDIARMLGQHDDDLARNEAFASGEPLPMSPNEPVAVAQPTAQSWDYVKRGLDDVIEGYRDGTTRRLNLDEAGRAKVGTAAALRGELVNLNPAYGEALQAGGEPLRLETAWRDMPKLMSNNVPVRIFEKRLGKMGAAERDAGIGGFLNDLSDQAAAGRLRLRQLSTPAFKLKIRRMVGEKAAADILDALKQEARLARGGRMAPGTNSVTAEVAEANREMDRGVGFMAELQRRADAGQGPIAAVTGATANAAASPFAGFVRGVQAPYNQAVRDEFGRILLDPEETLRVLRKRGPAPRAVNPMISYATPGVAVAAGGNSN